MTVREKMVELSMKVAGNMSRNSPAIPIPSRYHVFYDRLPPSDWIHALAKSYCRVFSEPPWNEEWEEKEVIRHIKNNDVSDSFMVLMEGNEQWKVGGFSWGKIVSLEQMGAHVGRFLEADIEGLKEILRNAGVKRIVYFDEVAILKSFRSGLDPLRFLIRPALEKGSFKSVFQTIFWSAEGSKIVPLARYMGYRPIYEVNALGKEIMFIINSDFRPFLYVLRAIETRKWVKLMKFNHLLLK